MSWEARPLVDHPHGVLRAVAIAGAPPPEALARLLPEEQAFAAGLAPLRRASWVAGRLALAAALDAAGAARAPIPATARGAPEVPPGFVGSVSHKAAIAAAIAARDEGAGLGIDVEEARPTAIDVSRKVLTAAELAAVDALPREERYRSVLVRFSIKEAIYKAVDPFVRRYVGFKEAEVEIGPRGEGIQRAEARLDLPEGAFVVEATWMEIEGHVLTTARVRRRALL